MLALNAVLLSLNLSDNKFDGLGVKALALGLAANQTLLKLDLSENRKTSLLLTIPRTLCLTLRRPLAVLTESDAAPLYAVLAWSPTLAKQIPDLDEAAINMTLVELVLNSNALGPKGARRIAGIVGSSSVSLLTFHLQTVWSCTLYPVCWDRAAMLMCTRCSTRWFASLTRFADALLPRASRSSVWPTT